MGQYTQKQYTQEQYTQQQYTQKQHLRCYGSAHSTLSHQLRACATPVFVAWCMLLFAVDVAAADACC